MVKRILIGLLCSFLLSNSLFAQQKYEREYRVKQEEVPASAQAFLAACSFSAKVKWFGEESLEGHSVEAKLKEEKVKYSIEFDTLGNLQDVEIDIPWEEVEQSAQEDILAHLNQQFEKHRLIKIQLQWTGSEAAVLELIRTGKTDKALNTKYEIVLKGKQGNKSAWYEFLFSEDGSFERKAIIIFRNTDNLDY
jgi:S-adenosylmethionine:diacylglycerol 3-amino-3-carboxypropyl transferase